MVHMVITNGGLTRWYVDQEVSQMAVSIGDTTLGGISAISNVSTIVIENCWSSPFQIEVIGERNMIQHTEQE